MWWRVECESSSIARSSVTVRAMESCGAGLALRHSQGWAVVRCGDSVARGVLGDDVAQLGRVRVGVQMAPWCGRSQLRIGVERPGRGSGRGRGRRSGSFDEKFRVQAVASAYPPIAQTEKTFRLPIDYYQVKISHALCWVFIRVAEFGTPLPYTSSIGAV